MKRVVVQWELRDVSHDRVRWWMGHVIWSGGARVVDTRSISGQSRDVGSAINSVPQVWCRLFPQLGQGSHAGQNLTMTMTVGWYYCCWLVTCFSLHEIFIINNTIENDGTVPHHTMSSVNDSPEKQLRVIPLWRSTPIHFSGTGYYEQNGWSKV